ncbi:MAG: 16S rRNA (cytidine(1402)-2'-O)-methyltransferase [Fimbriimonadaceae bacterium]
MSSSRLVLVATPIGNLQDLSARAIQTLKDCDLWIVEDTRVSGKLQTVLEIKKPMRVLNEHTNDAKVSALAKEVEAGVSCALLTDGGCPSISDPGARLVDACAQLGIEIDSIPGPSAVTNALALSGFFAQRFAFLGFPARKPGDIRELFRPFAESSLTLAFFESPFRYRKTLAIAAEVLGDRRAVICREMTKLHQEIIRLDLTFLAEMRDIGEKGEFTIVIEGRRRNRVADD